MNILQKAFDYQAVYNGLRFHFNKSYDYSKYGPLRKNQNPDKFEISPDRFIFIGFAKKFSDQEVFEEYLKLYGFRLGQVPYLRNFNDREIDKEFNEVWMKIRYSFDYQLSIMLSELSIQDLKTNGSDWPIILDKLYDGTIYPSQFVAIDKTYGLMEKYSKIFSDDLLFQEKFGIYTKYKVLTNIKSLDTVKTTIKTTLKTS